jgi:hypothetical protein
VRWNGFKVRFLAGDRVRSADERASASHSAVLVLKAANNAPTLFNVGEMRRCCTGRLKRLRFDRFMSIRSSTISGWRCATKRSSFEARRF